MLSFSIKPVAALDQALHAGGKKGKKRGRITVLHHIKTLLDVSPSAETAAQESKLSKSSILTEYQDCGTWQTGPVTRGELPHCSRMVPVHSSLVKAELNEVIADDVITPQPTDCINSIVCKIKEAPDGE